jgi:recombination protein RecA
MFSKPRFGAMSRAAPLEVGRRGLDRLLGGGVPRGQIVEVSGSSSSGKATLAFGVCLRALERGQAAAWIDVSGSFWPVDAALAGLPLDKLLVVKVQTAAAALRAAHIILSSSGAVAALVVDLPPSAQVRERELVALQRLAERSATAFLFLTARLRTAPSLGAAVALRLHAERRIGRRVRIEVLRNKQGATQRSIEIEEAEAFDRPDPPESEAGDPPEANEENDGPDRVRAGSAL